MKQQERVGRPRRFAGWIRNQAAAVLREHSSPACTALGFSLGCFIGIFPSFLVGTPIAFYLAGRFGWNRAAAMAGTFVTNPITAPIFYSTSAWLGMAILGTDLQAVQPEGFLNYLRHFGIAFLVGNTLFAFACASLLGLTIFFIAWRRQRAISQTLQTHLAAENAETAQQAENAAFPVGLVPMEDQPKENRQPAPKDNLETKPRIEPLMPNVSAEVVVLQARPSSSSTISQLSV